jgi:hypothetical protein
MLLSSRYGLTLLLGKRTISLLKGTKQVSVCHLLLEGYEYNYQTVV